MTVLKTMSQIEDILSANKKWELQVDTEKSLCDLLKDFTVSALIDLMEAFDFVFEQLIKEADGDKDYEEFESLSRKRAVFNLFCCKRLAI